MDKNLPNSDVHPAEFASIAPPTRERIHTRARELAEIAGRAPHQVSPADYHDARRELTGGPDDDKQEAVLAALPESKRWDPVPGSDGLQTSESPDEDDDDEGRNESARLVAEGVKEADHDQRLQAARAAAAAEKSARDQP